jgi:ribosomal protein S18 acetylase RimI-like enzyme
VLEIVALAEDVLDEARAVLAAACAHDRAAPVAREKLLEPAPAGPARAWGARLDGALVGVAAATADRVRLIAVIPEARGRGAGSALLIEAERAGARRALDLPGNYLAPGVDVKNVESIAWLERRGWRRRAENLNLLLDARAATLRDPPAGYEVRRATMADAEALCAAVQSGFGGAWPFEVRRALAGGGAHVALSKTDGEYAAFAVHDGNNQGLGWFGPAGTWPAHRGRGLGEVLLAACLVDVAAAHELCEVAWVGPRGFYERAGHVLGERRFAVMRRDDP